MRDFEEKFGIRVKKIGKNLGEQLYKLFSSLEYKV